MNHQSRELINCPHMPKIVFITGATSGFGKACAEKFAAMAMILFLMAEVKKGFELKQHLEKKFNTAMLVLSFDVSYRKKFLMPLKLFLKNGKI